MESRITINENAYFYQVTSSITKKAIERIVIDATRHKTGSFICKNIRKSHRAGGQTIQTTLVVFKYEGIPTFLTPGSEKEIRYGYLLLVEYGSYLVISKRATQDFHKSIDHFITELPYGSLTKFRVDNATTFPKASMSNLDNGKNVLRRLHLEATDVKGVLSTVTASNKVLYNFRLKNPGKETAIAVGTSRINDLGPKAGYNAFCLWVVNTCNAIAAYSPSVNFIDHFAEPLTYATTISTLTPAGIFFELYPLIDDVATGIITRIYYQYADGNQRDLNISNLTQENDYCLDLQATTTTGTYKVQNTTDKNMTLRVGGRSITVHSTKLLRIKLEFADGETTNLMSYINKESLFMVTFDNCEVRYKSKALFKDSRLLNNIPFFLNFIKADGRITTMTSEKGAFTSSSTCFEATCLFGGVERHFAADCDYLVCDDLGDEWADYIGFKKNKWIRFYHAKSSSKAYSASAFHDLISQALKNLGHFDFNKDLSSKISSINRQYSGTNIHCLRKGDSVANCFRYLKETYNYANVQKEVVLVVNFLSKTQLESELALLRRGGARNQTIQLLWLLSSLISVCSERGIRLEIITKP